MDSKKLAVLLAAVDQGSFTQAAERMQYTPSGITHMMNSLENEFGFQLLNRSNKGITLTENGKALLPTIRSLVKTEEILAQQISALNSLNAGSLTIGSYSSVAVHWLPQVIQRFNCDYPNIKIKVFEGVRQEIVELLQEKKIDIGFISYREKMAFDWQFLREDPFVAVLSPDHEKAQAATYDLNQLATESFIMPAGGHDFDVVALLTKYHLHPNVAYETFENYSALAMIERNMGMSVMNCLITKGRSQNLVRLPLKTADKIDLGIASLDFAANSPAAKKFVEYAKMELLA
jgi:DNA-binding transcriptional LysR family regulator